MTPYRTFLYEPEGSRIVRGTVAEEPDPRQPQAGQWKVIRNGGRIQVIARVDNRTDEIATARWRDDALSDLAQDGERPTPVEWRALELALTEPVQEPPEEVPPAPAPPVELEPVAPAPSIEEAPAVRARRYLTFLLDLSSLAENKAIASSVRYAPDAEVPRPFVWKIIRDAADRVIVIAHAPGGPRPIASASWNEAGLDDQRQADATEPNGNQWAWIETALFAEGDTAAAMASSCDATEPVPRFDRRPEVPASDQAWRSAPARARADEKVDRRPRAIVLVTAAVIAAGALAMYTLRSRPPARTSDEPRPAPVAVTPVPPPAPIAPAPEPPVEVRIARAATLTEALALARPAMADTTDELPAAAALLARYGKLRWAEVESPETTVAKVQKDAEAERGKRLCGEGEIERITRRDVERRKTFVGRLVLPDGDALAFVALGTTGDLVKRMRATFCGVVTGVSGDDVAVVGMFDLPENRTPQVEQ